MDAYALHHFWLQQLRFICVLVGGWVWWRAVAGTMETLQS